ncbi:MAG TPA: NfeD family protein [Clostridiaceae bacterium]|nr:NfeD family protein [Clostridiaceae bacterium]
MDNMLVYIWLGLMIVLIGIEAATVSLTTIWLAGGSLAALILALFDLPLWLQITAFLVVSIIMIVFTRPVAVKYLKVGTQKTNTDALIGTTGIVIMDISGHKAGQVKVKGQVWTAISKSGEYIPAGTEAEVLAVEGVKLVVKALDKA